MKINMNQDNKNKKFGFVAFPHSMLDDLREGDLTPSEYWVLCYVRHSANPFGEAHLSFDDIWNDVYAGQVDKSVCYKKMGSLREKGYIDYPDRQGRRGSFKTEIDNFLLKNGKIKRLDEPNIKRGGRSKEEEYEEEAPNGRQNSRGGSHKFSSAKSTTDKGYIAKLNKRGGRSSYNDNEKENYKNINRSKKPSKDGLTLVDDFNPDSRKESRCKEIAKGLEEKHINPVLALCREYGIEKLEKVYGLLKQKIREGKDIENRGAYFQKMIAEDY